MKYEREIERKTKNEGGRKEDLMEERESGRMCENGRMKYRENGRLSETGGL